MTDISAVLLVFLQLAFWPVTLYFVLTLLTNRPASNYPIMRRILHWSVQLVLLPIKQSYRIAHWLIDTVASTTPDYKLRQIYLEDYTPTPLQFYGAIDEAFAQRQIIGATMSRVARLEWHLLSTRRVYLLIRFRDAVCFLSAVPL